MFVRNWDNRRTALTIGSGGYWGTGYRNQETVYKNYRGERGTSYDGNSEMRTLGFADWSTGSYTDSPSSSYLMIWPGGKVGGEYLHSQPGIHPDKENYDDCNLHSPFYGTTSEQPGYEIFGQNHVLGSLNYDEKTDTWSRTITREFKNISGKPITVTELGVFMKQYLYVRELLAEPIEVEDQCYFKLSFTYTVETPHENMLIQRKRLYSIQASENFQYANSGYAVSRRKQKMLAIRMLPSYGTSENIDSYFEQYPTVVQGWEIKNITRFKMQNASSNYYGYYVSIDIFDPIVEDPNNSIILNKRSPGYSDYYDHFVTYYLEDEVKNIEAIQVLSNQPQQTILTKPENSQLTNVLWLFINGREGQYKRTLQLQNQDGTIDYMDYEPVYSWEHTVDIMGDCTSATEHIIRNLATTNPQTIVELAVTARDKNGNEIPIYKDVPVN